MAMRLNLGFLGQIGDDRPVGLHPPQDVGRHRLAQRTIGIVRAGGVARGIALELLGRAEQAGNEEIENRPKVAQMILYRRER